MNRQILTFWALSAAIVVYWLTTTALAQDPIVPTPEKVQIVITGNTFTINGKKLDWPPSEKVLIEVLGKPSRIEQPSNRYLVWDEHGVCAEWGSGDRKFDTLSLHIVLDKQHDWQWSKKPFRGTVRVDGADVTAQSTLEELTRSNKGEPFKRCKIIPVSFRSHRKTLDLVLHEAIPKRRSEKVNFSNLAIVDNPDR